MKIVFKKCYNEFSYPKDFNPASTYQRVHVRFSWKKNLLFGLVCWFFFIQHLVQLFILIQPWFSSFIIK